MLLLLVLFAHIISKVLCANGSINRNVSDIFDDIIKSDFDRNEYRAIKLPNGLVALLVHDEKCEIVRFLFRAQNFRLE